VETHSRAAEFLVGVITGYFMFLNEQTGTIEKIFKRNKKLLTLLGWVLSIGFFWFHICKFQHVHIPLIRQIYQSIERELWASAVSWIIFACHTLKSGGIIRSFLSHPNWQPLSKLSLSMYLLHMHFIYSTGNFFPKKVGFLWEMHVHSADIVFSIILGACAYILVEAPVSRLVDYYLRSPKSDAKSLGKKEEEGLPLLKNEKVFKL
jgi:peptidoglycan/LPS O-acetylase OafA/YrhL